MKGWVLATLVLTCLALCLGMFLLMIFMIQQLATTNQLIYLLGVLASAALTVLYGRIMLSLIDQ